MHVSSTHMKISVLITSSLLNNEQHYSPYLLPHGWKQALGEDLRTQRDRQRSIHSIFMIRYFGLTVHSNASWGKTVIRFMITAHHYYYPKCHCQRVLSHSTMLNSEFLPRKNRKQAKAFIELNVNWETWLLCLK